MIKSKIIELMEEKDSVIVFDVDGVLGAFEFGKHNHNGCLDCDWEGFIQEKDPYETIRPIKTIQEWILIHKDPSKIFVCAASASDLEDRQKTKFVVDHYGIPRNNIFMVRSKEKKLDVLKQIHNAYFPELDESKIIMVDDTIKTLTYIQESSGYSTAHISSFIE